ncbi:MAG: NifB/NifX family molybdenum-iron cluster-binding protein [Elusimicrobia bacterium]|nr:NifB/NifX family molybdenum-iron cluster-binding protein [Elusimicrobiota bacterium]
MNICIPVENNDGLESRVCGHFGSAPIFMIVDCDALTCKAVKNANQHHAHGMCQPLAVLSGEKLDALVVGGIGMGALMKLNAAGIKVYRTSQPTVQSTLDALKQGRLEPVTPDTACAHHHPHP